VRVEPAHRSAFIKGHHRGGPSRLGLPDQKAELWFLPPLTEAQIAAIHGHLVTSARTDGVGASPLELPGACLPPASS
jgi:hypothetical protein